MIIYLASSSPYRFSLLKDAGFSVNLIQHFSDEVIKNKENCSLLNAFVNDIVELKMSSIDKDYVCHMADQINIESFILLVADTETMIDGGKVLGKPLSLTHAKEIFLSCNNKKVMVSSAFKFVVFRKIEKKWKEISSEKGSGFSEIIISWTLDDIEKYIREEGLSILNRSSGFGIEGRGSIYIKSFKGSYTNTLGFPMFEFYTLFKKYL